uniref:Pyridoxal phosphate biosynthetic protein n=1 Tax=Paulinella chromatophora TaxID=39717 RepID=B1X5M1_PAUCH|nr:pyridoxal phosphate biosynthetic protein [Paulinella chromatophora]ACB43240.1 pyridoxal phosphate biosynthetic protein [Paulinella chromatophora]|eukprot:gb/GEZN01006227.1/.p1 GENE.gb/GEZN01006227.1/~~gb/GEZN01006227.1/.p1  ORF type:complete len:248 (-),score=9.99 gb/GEZN01006227.1/:239-982(-)
MVGLGVNIDHIANVRQARSTLEPDPVPISLLAEIGGADTITVHLREDRRHIQDRDVALLRAVIRSRLNLEMAATNEMIDIALQIKPDMVTFVPERREEITTEGGLDVVSQKLALCKAVEILHSKGIPVSFFVDPVIQQLETCKMIGAHWVELHTGTYAEAGSKQQALELARLSKSTAIARQLGLRVNAGHGLNYQNVEPVAIIKGMEELNIGHSIVARALVVGIEEAVRQMKALLHNPHCNSLFGSI